MKIKNLDGIDFEQVFAAFENAFADYAIKFDKTEVRSMLKRRGFNPELSFAAFDEQERIVAFTFNGTGMHAGIPTAYDTGTGTVKEFRGQGLAQEIFQYSVPVLKKAGIRQYLLEVLQDNAPAIAVYSKLGFNITREFKCFRRNATDLQLQYNLQLDNVDIHPVSTDVIASATRFCDFMPSWQNSLDSINRAGSDLMHFGAFCNRQLAGYCVFDPLTGDLTQIAVDPDYRRKGIATALLNHMLQRNRASIIKVLNIDASCSGMSAFIERCGITAASNQFEMLMQL